MEDDDNHRSPKPTEADRKAELWLIENREAIESANAYVEKHGLPLAHFQQLWLAAD